MELPKTLILGITTHGVLQVNPMNQVYVYKVPEGITITRTNQTAIGVCNILNDYIIDDVITFIDNTYLRSDMDDATKLSHAAAVMIDAKRHMLKVVRRTKGYKTDGEAIEFVRGSDQPVETATYNPGDLIPDKEFFIKPSDDKTTSRHNHRINILNIPDIHIDLMSEIIEPNKLTKPIPDQVKQHAQEGFVTTEDIVLFAQQYGVEHIMIFDFTCGNIAGIEDDRELRRVYRHMRKEHNGGKTRKRKTKKTKTRKGKKRTSWRH